jgi:hypothetical protein
MAKHPIYEDWSDYDDKKKKKGDARFFACTEEWEVDYLKNKIKRLYPALAESDILKAIEACCKTLGAPRPREEFVDCVLRRLGKI